MRRILGLITAMMGVVTLFAEGAAAQLLIAGNDEKVSLVGGHRRVNPPGKDTVSIIDISDRSKPRIIADLPLMNSIVGPPTNLAITPDEHLALVANSLDWVPDGQSWKGVPDNKVSVIDLTLTPPAVIATIEVGRQPSGMAINHAGTMALIANRADNSVSVLAIDGTTVRNVDTVALAPPGSPNQAVSAVAITPDGKRALVAKFATHKVALLAIDGTKVTYGGYDMATGLYPLNVQITPDGKLGIVVNNGGNGTSDGQVDTAAVIDLELDPPRVVDQVVIGDGPEGLAMSAAGGYAAALIQNGSGNPRSAFFHHDHSTVSLLKIEDKKVRKVGEAAVGGLAEGIAFSPDGRYLYVANDLDSDMTILRLQGSRLITVGAMRLPGHPASLRGSTP